MHADREKKGGGLLAAAHLCQSNDGLQGWIEEDCDCHADGAVAVENLFLHSGYHIKRVCHDHGVMLCRSWFLLGYY